jgi:hypothetical protein
VANGETTPPPTLLCAGCGAPVGVYEPVWLEHADGSLHPSSELNLDAQARRQAVRAWHAGCLPLETGER